MNYFLEQFVNYRFVIYRKFNNLFLSFSFLSTFQPGYKKKENQPFRLYNILSFHS